jgi:DNA replication and repair protein RecF
MMLSQARLLMKTARRASVFLIDDIGAELDLSHSERFFRQLSELGSQILATSNSRPTAAQAASWRGSHSPEPVMFHVEHGSIGRAPASAE